jgi:predicted P-loop ATPase/GTPase
MTEEEVTAYTATMRNWLPTLASGYTAAISAFNVAEKSESKLACVIKDYEKTTLPFLKELVERLKQNFETTFGRSYSSENLDCNQQASVVNEILNAAPNGVQARDNAIASLRQHHDLLTAESQHITSLLNDIVAQRSIAHKNELEGIKSLIEEITKAENGAAK